MKIVNTHQIMITYNERSPKDFIEVLQNLLKEIEERKHVAEIHIDSFQYDNDIMNTAIIIEREENELAKE